MLLVLLQSPEVREGEPNDGLPHGLESRFVSGYAHDPEVDLGSSALSSARAHVERFGVPGDGISLRGCARARVPLTRRRRVCRGLPGCPTIWLVDERLEEAVADDLGSASALAATTSSLWCHVFDGNSAERPARRRLMRRSESTASAPATCSATTASSSRTAPGRIGDARRHEILGR